MSKFLLRGLNGLVSLAVGLCLAVCGAYAAYALWDNQQIYSAAEDVQAAMQELKPRVSEDDEEGGPSFAELLAVNPDVRAWITVDNTHIDYPVLQGTDNLTYVNTDVYGEFALAGSIFMDSRNDPGFADLYTLLYGHHMEGGRMFGDLDLFKEKKFFDENRTGTLMLPDRVCKLEIFACLVVSASEERIFQPAEWVQDIDGLMDYAREDALHYDEALVARVQAAEAEGTPAKVLALSTCSAEYTDARTIVLAFINE